MSEIERIMEDLKQDVNEDKWARKRLEKMDAALTKIEKEAQGLEELEHIAELLEQMGRQIDPEWIGYLFIRTGARCRELAYIGEEIRMEVNEGFTVKDE